VVLTHTGLIPKRFARTAELPNIWGIKDSTDDLDLFLKLRDLLDDRLDFTILIRPETAGDRGFPNGGVCGRVNFYPEL
jgi:dihydrodipicolinate synthase/N-acetylneuraminate lyase